jgi:hypothetical protein
VLSELNYCLQKKILTQDFSNKLIVKSEDNVPAGKLCEKITEIFFASLKSLKKGSISQRYVSADPDFHQNVMDSGDPPTLSDK